MGELVDAARAIGLPFESAESGRWVRLGDSFGQTVYIVEYTCDDECQKHYVLFPGSTGANSTSPKMKFTTIAEALREAKSLLSTPEEYSDLSDLPTTRVPTVVP
ncbi:MAG TPA: hypothetical protein VMP10_02360 [Chloroflexota bacterium]|nr:hypothetical protein [Chloroflexota bacterium]